MPREANLPPQFAALAGKVHHVQRHSATEYSASCPVCGDQGHTGRDWPDRFRLFLDSKVLGWCRRCSYLWFPDMASKEMPKPTWKEVQRWRAEQEARHKRVIAQAEKSLAMLAESNIWDRYCEQMGVIGRAYWTRRGVPDSWQDFWRLGWDSGHRFGEHVTDVATIPLFGPEWHIRQIKYRLQNESKGQYRYELSGVEAPPFLCDPDADYSGHVYAVEGEIKSMVTFGTLDDSATSMIGMPGTTPGPATMNVLKGADRVTLIMDPGAKRDGIKLAREIGIGKTWLLVPPVKIDDGILMAKLNKREVRQLLASALELSQFVTG